MLQNPGSHPSWMSTALYNTSYLNFYHQCHTCEFQQRHQIKRTLVYASWQHKQHYRTDNIYLIKYCLLKSSQKQYVKIWIIVIMLPVAPPLSSLTEPIYCIVSNCSVAWWDLVTAFADSWLYHFVTTLTKTYFSVKAEMISLWTKLLVLQLWKRHTEAVKANDIFFDGSLASAHCHGRF